MKKYLAIPVLLTLCAGVTFFHDAAQAAPSLKYGGSNVSIQEPLSPEHTKELADVLGKAKTLNGLRVSLNKIDNETFAKVCELAAGMSTLEISSSKDLTDISPISKLSNLTSLSIRDAGISDCSPLAGLTKLTRINLSLSKVSDAGFLKDMTALKTIDISLLQVKDLSALPSLPAVTNARFCTSADITPIVKSMPNLTVLDLTGSNVDDLSPIKNLSKVNYVNLYGCTLKDFSPLAEVPSLRKVMYYASKGADFADLGKLQQVTELKGGLTKLDDISFVAGMPNLKKFDVFAEYVTDYSPLAKTNIEEFQIWNMRMLVGDITPVGQMKSLKKMKFWDAEGCQNSAALNGLENLQEMVIAGYNKKGGEPFDCSGASSWKNLKKLEARDVVLANTDALSACTLLESVDLSNANTAKKASPASLAFLGKLNGVKYLTIRKSSVADFDAIASCTSLQRVTLEQTSGVAGLAALKQLPNLKYLNLTKGAFPDTELQGFAPSVKIQQR